MTTAALWTKHRPVALAIARDYRIPGMDPDDVRQEALVALWSNPDERVLTPFMGVGSEVYAAVLHGRFGIGVELKPSYYRQAVKNLRTIGREAVPLSLLSDETPAPAEDGESNRSETETFVPSS